jgi:hypothetical protein
MTLLPEWSRLAPGLPRHAAVGEGRPRESGEVRAPTKTLLREDNEWND